jgi:hypothetical protein
MKNAIVDGIEMAIEKQEYDFQVKELAKIMEARISPLANRVKHLQNSNYQLTQEDYDIINWSPKLND